MYLVLILEAKTVPGFVRFSQFLELGRESASPSAANILVAKPGCSCLAPKGQPSTAAVQLGPVQELHCVQRAAPGQTVAYRALSGRSDEEGTSRKTGNSWEGRSMKGRVPNTSTGRRDEGGFPVPWRAGAGCSTVPGWERSRPPALC